MEGRVLELAGAAGLGKGTRLVEQKEKSRATKKIRAGIDAHKEIIRKKQLEEVSPVACSLLCI